METATTKLKLYLHLALSTIRCAARGPEHLRELKSDKGILVVAGCWVRRVRLGSSHSSVAIALGDGEETDLKVRAGCVVEQGFACPNGARSTPHGGPGARADL